jgi:uncharacterized membrane protein YebE (DUF533 family)
LNLKKSFPSKRRYRLSEHTVMINQAQSLLDQLLNAGQRGGAAEAESPGGPGFDLGQLLNGKAGLATGAVAGGLVGLLLGDKGGRKIVGTAAKLGGAALVGGLAYKAYRDWQAQQNSATPSSPAASAPVATAAALPSPEGTPFMPSAPSALEDLSARLLRAMVSAAKADGHITERERVRITSQLQSAGLGPELRGLLEAELARPLDINAVAHLARSEEEAAEIYAASLLVVDPDLPAEKAYLALLAARLKLDPKLVEHLHANAAAITA